MYPLSPTDLAAPPDSLSVALHLLAHAHAHAHALGLDPRQFAVELDEFLRVGVTRTDLRVLVARGLADHVVERRRKAPDRRFRPRDGLALFGRSCFVLTSVGQAVAPADVGPAGPATPIWDAAVRELRWLGQVVKRFRQPADNQERVLTAFQEEGWPRRIDDPLPPVTARDSQLRLRDTIKCLNRGQADRAVRFSADGTGEGVLWAADRPATSELPRSVPSTTPPAG